MDKKPYILVLGSHKGGTGRTTAALALAQLWGEAGLRVALVDADPLQAARLVALDSSGHCPWPGVTFYPDLPETGRVLLGNDLVLVDCPALPERNAQRVLRLADGIVLCCLAEPLSLRTLPAATAAIQSARRVNPRLEFLGLLIGLYYSQDPLQQQMLAQVRQKQGDLLGPPIPYQQEVCDWPLFPGSPLPPGVVREAYRQTARLLEGMILPVTV